MSSYVNAPPFTRTLNRFEYHLEDMDCTLCQYWRGKKKGCSRAVCCCETERSEAIAKGRIKRSKRIGRWDM